MIQYLTRAEPLLQKESQSASFGTKLVPSLNGVDPSFMNSVAGSYLSSAQISYTISMFFYLLIDFNFGFCLEPADQYNISRVGMMRSGF